MTNPRVIVFEGLDRSGKTTLCRAFAEATGQIHTCIDRWTTSCRVYDKFFERTHGRGEINAWRTTLEKTLVGFGLTVVYVDTPPFICHVRGAQYTLEELADQRTLFLGRMGWLEAVGARTLVLPTTVNHSDSMYPYSVEDLVKTCRGALNT